MSTVTTSVSARARIRGESIRPARRPGRFAALVSLAMTALMVIASATAATCHQYIVNIQGTITSNFGAQQVAVTQYAIWRDAGAGANPYEFVLTTFQDLNASAQIGQIELMTNSGFARNPGIASQRFDLARVSVANVIQFELNSAMSFQLPSPNVFVAPGVGMSEGGLGGLCYLPGAGQDLCRDFGRADVLSVAYFVPRNGGGYFYSPDGQGATIAGEINLAGSSLDNSSLQGQYQASFNGNYAGSQECN